jgi:O-antigen ligase
MSTFVELNKNKYFFPLAILVAVALSIFTAKYSFVISVILFLGLLATLFIFSKPELGLYFIAFVIPIGRYTLPGIPFNVTASDVLIIITLVSWLTRKLVYEKKYKPANDSLFIFLSIFCIFSALSLFNCNDKMRGSIELIQTFEYFLVIPYLFLDLIKNKKQIMIILWMMVAGSLIYAPLGILEAVRGMRATSIAGHANAFGAYLAMIIPIIYSLLLKEKRHLQRFIIVCSLVLSALAFMGTLSRGSWLALFASMLVLSFKEGFKKNFIIGVTFIVIISGLVAFLMPEMVSSRIRTMTEMQVETTGERLEQVDNAINMIKTHPFLGVGLNETPDYNPFQHAQGEVHNFFLQIGAERGLGALTIIIAFFSFYIYRLNKMTNTFIGDYKDYSVVFLSISIAFLVASLFGYPVGRGNANVFMMFVGMSLALSSINKEIVTE